MISWMWNWPSIDRLFAYLQEEGKKISGVVQEVHKRKEGKLVYSEWWEQELANLFGKRIREVGNKYTKLNRKNGRS